MASNWNILDLDSKHFDRAYVLLQLLDEGRSKDDWMVEIEDWRSQGDGRSAGVACIIDDRDYILCLCFYVLRESTNCGKALEIDRIVMPDTLAPLLSHDLANIIDGFAREKSCSAVHVGTTNCDEAGPLASGNLIAAALSQDFQYSAAHWCRRIA